MASVRIIIDGREVGSTVLEAAHGADFYVPTLCSHTAVHSHGTCRLCNVAIEGVPGYLPTLDPVAGVAN